MILRHPITYVHCPLGQQLIHFSALLRYSAIIINYIPISTHLPQSIYQKTKKRNKENVKKQLDASRVVYVEQQVISSTYDMYNSLNMMARITLTDYTRNNRIANR